MTAREWGSYPILNFREVPVIDVLMMPRPDEPPLGAGESAVGAGHRGDRQRDLRRHRRALPRAAVHAGAHPARTAQRGADGSRGIARAGASTCVPIAHLAKPFARRTGVFATAAALCAAVVGIGAAVLPWRAIAPIARPDASVYTAATIERGRQLAALGDCVVCHTAADGALNAGGRPLETPFGTIYATNLTPDVETGIGAWSFSAFQRAMRDGISRDGRHLYPAFPYPHFAKTTDDDLHALYAYLMAQPPVRAETPENALAFPFNLRPLMAVWNALFHQAASSHPILRSPRRGIAAPIWSTGSAIAAPATRRATRSARRRRTPISPADLPTAGKRRR